MPIYFHYDPANNPLNQNEWAFPLLEIIHIVGFAFSVGTIAVVDFCLLGVGLNRLSAPRLMRNTEPWTLTGLAIMLTSGPLIFTSDANLYLNNGPFLIKMLTLTLAIVFNYTIHRRIVLSERSSPAAVRIAALVSLSLWTTVVFAGLLIAFF